METRAGGSTSGKPARPARVITCGRAGPVLNHFSFGSRGSVVSGRQLSVYVVIVPR